MSLYNKWGRKKTKSEAEIRKDEIRTQDHLAEMQYLYNEWKITTFDSTLDDIAKIYKNLPDGQRYHVLNVKPWIYTTIRKKGLIKPHVKEQILGYGDKERWEYHFHDAKIRGKMFEEKMERQGKKTEKERIKEASYKYRPDQSNVKVTKKGPPGGVKKAKVDDKEQIKLDNMGFIVPGTKYMMLL